MKLLGTVVLIVAAVRASLAAATAGNAENIDGVRSLNPSNSTLAVVGGVFSCISVNKSIRRIGTSN